MLIAKASQLLAPLPTAHIIPKFVRYACRLVPYGEVAALVGTFPMEKHDNFRTLREWFDHAPQKNDLYRACWLLSRAPRPRYQPTAQRFGLAPDELQRLYHCLDHQDVTTLQQRPKPMHYSEHAIQKVLQSVAKWQRFIVKRRLQFCIANDHALDQQDLYGELTTHGIRIIRRYEVYGYDTTVMASFVARGMDNYAKNIATRAGKLQRNPLLVLSTRSKIKTVWYMNQRERIVEQCRVHPDDATQRKVKHDTIYYRAEFPHREPVFVSSNLLYRDYDEADAALQAYCTGFWERRNYLIDLTPDTTGDWMPVLCSLDAVNPVTNRSLHDSIASRPVATSQTTLRFSAQHVATMSPNVQRFVETVNGDWDELFEQHCQQRYGKSASELPIITYVRAAREFCDVSTYQLREELAELNPFDN